MNQTIKELLERKSVRAYEDRAIEPEKKDMILQAALQAPTAGNMTLYSIIDVTDRKKKETLAVTCDNQPFIAKAPMVLVFIADYQKWYDLFCRYESEVRSPGAGDLLLAWEDALIAAQNAVVAAHSLGIGSCYIGDIMENYETHRDLFDLPQYALPAAMVVFGYPTKQQTERGKPRRFLCKDVVAENSYRHFTPEEFEDSLKEKEHKEKDFESWLKAFCRRKWNSSFSREMSRSAEVMLQSWKKEEK